MQHVTSDRSRIRLIRDQLGTKMTALLADAFPRSEVTEWIDGRKTPNANQLRRLRFAHDMFTRVNDAQGTYAARLWFTGANVGPKQISPVEGIREDRFDEVQFSAWRLIHHQWR